MSQQQRQQRQWATGLQIGVGELGLGEILIAKAEPDIYLNNPFRLLQLPTNASLSQIQGKIHELELRIQLGIDPPSNLSISSQDLQFILQRLSDPLQRLTYEIFWFWGDEKNDDGLIALRDGNIGDAITIWEQRLNDFNAVHNLSVLFHFMALELELRGNLKMATTRHQWWSHWQKAWKLWCKSIDSEGIKRYLQDRVRELNDPRVSERTVEEFSKALPLALALINARLALRAVERTDDDSLMSFHKELLSASTSEAIAIWALKRAAKPLIDELQVLSQTTHQDDKSHNPLQKAHQLLEQAMRPARILDKLLPGDPDVRSLRDKAAMEVRRLVYGVAKPDNLSQLPEIVKLLKAAANLASTAEVKKSLINEASSLEAMSQVISLLNELTALLKEADAMAQMPLHAMDDAERLLNKAEPLLRQLDAVSIEDSKLEQLRDQFHDAVAAQAHRLVVEAVRVGNKDFARAKTILERALKIARDPQGRQVLQMEIQSLQMIIIRQREDSTRKTGCVILVVAGLIIGLISFISDWWQQTNSTPRSNKVTVQHGSSQTVLMAPSPPKASSQAQSKTKDQWIKYLGLQQYLKEYEHGRLKQDSIREILSDLTYGQSSVRLDKETYGDLDGDGLKEKIVVVGINAGGSGTFVYLLVLKKGRCIAVKPLGDRTVINSLTVKNREIVLDMLTHGPNDPMATPTKKVVTRYKLMGGNLLSEKSLRLAHLERRIKNLKSEIARIESVIPELTDLVMSLRSNIETLQRQITAIEQTHPLGFFTEEELQNYRVLVRRHNDLVDKHNALVRQGRLLLQQYKQKIAEYKRLVDEYNNLRLEVE